MRYWTAFMNSTVKSQSKEVLQIIQVTIQVLSEFLKGSVDLESKLIFTTNVQYSAKVCLQGSRILIYHVVTYLMISLLVSMNSKCCFDEVLKFQGTHSMQILHTTCIQRVFQGDIIIIFNII